MPQGPDLDPIPNKRGRRAGAMDNERNLQVKTEEGMLVENTISEKRIFPNHLWKHKHRIMR